MSVRPSGDLGPLTSGGTQPGAPPRGAPGWVVWCLIALATFLAAGATLNAWVDRQALDTDEWVEVTDAMLADDDVRAALSTFLVAELFRTVDVRGGLEESLPGPASQLAGPLSAALRANAVGLADQLLGTPATADLWRTVNTTAHTAFVRIVRDDVGPALSTGDGSFVVDARALLVRLTEALGLPGNVADQVPADAGQIVVFDSDQLDVAQIAVAAVDRLSLVLFVVVVILYAAAVGVAARRRIALRNVGWALAVAGAGLLVVRRVALRVATEQLADAESGRAAVRSIATIATTMLNDLAWAGVSLGAVIVLFAVATGPSNQVKAVRRWSAPVMVHPVGAWAVALGMLAAYLAVVPGFSVQRWVPAIVFVALFVVAVERLRRQVVSEQQGAAPPVEAEPAGNLG